MNYKVSSIDGVRDELHDEAREIAANAYILHLQYHDPTDEHESEFKAERGRIDSYAVMQHRAVLSLEFGWTTKNGRFVPGKYTMHRAAGLA